MACQQRAGMADKGECDGMVTIGMVLNGFTISAAVRRYRLGNPEGVVILGIRDIDSGDGEHSDWEWVIAEVVGTEVLSAEPATWWDNGRYFHSRNGDDAASVTRAFAYRTGLQGV